MSRDHRKLRTFVEADALVIAVYRFTGGFPTRERYGLQGQLCRAAVSVPANIVEGCVRSSGVEYRRFLEIALGSARECAYLLDLSHRLGLADGSTAGALAGRYSGLCAGLTSQRASIDRAT